MKESLNRIFRRHFYLDLEERPELLEASYALRYQVYCLETGYEDASAFPDGLERDGDDAHSVHGLVYYRARRDGTPHPS